MTETTAPNPLAPYPLAVIMEWIKIESRWASERWEARGVVQDVSPAGSAERVIVKDDRSMQVLFPGFVLRLHRDESEGYIYNITSPQPKIFILWRMHGELARPESLTVSYHEGARWMDAEETVNGVALPPDLIPWIAAFAEVHYEPETPKKKRYASSRDKGVASHRDGVK